MRVVLGVAGGIAAYKAAHVIRRLREIGHTVTVVPTPSALEFVGAPTFEALSGRPVTTDVFDFVDQVNHVRIGQDADLVIIAPATANTIAKIAAGMADDLLTATVLTTTAPVVVAPAMHTEMWLNPATVANIATLRSRGVHILEPAVGRLTGPDSGPGRLPEPEDIVAFALAAVGSDEPSASAQGGALTGRRVVVSAGGTREALDPVRFLGNRSSGKQGIALARAAHAAGAEIELVAAHVDTGLLSDLPADISITPIESTLDLQEAMETAQASADVIIMASPGSSPPADPASSSSASPPRPETPPTPHTSTRSRSSAAREPTSSSSTTSPPTGPSATTSPRSSSSPPTGTRSSTQRGSRARRTMLRKRSQPSSPNASPQ